MSSRTPPPPEQTHRATEPPSLLEGDARKRLVLALARLLWEEELEEARKAELRRMG